MSVPEIPSKYKYMPLSTINKGKTDELFAFLVRKIYICGRAEEFLNHIQLSNLIFNEPDSIYLKKVTNEFGNYFEYCGSKKRLFLEKVYQEHQWIWTGKKSTNKKFDLYEIVSSVEDEIRQTRIDESTNFVLIKNIFLVTILSGMHIYKADLEIENDKMMSLNEGQQLKLIDRNQLSNNITVLDFNSKDEIISFQSSSFIDSHKAKIQVSNIYLLYKLKYAVLKLKPNNHLLWKLILNKPFPNSIGFNHEIYDLNLDNSQKLCQQNCLEKDISYIWGPPGTGKSHTLARILLNLYNSNESTVVCAIANVAVDGLLEKTIELLKEYQSNKRIDLLKERKIIRIGYSQSNRIRSIPEIKFENSILMGITTKLEAIDMKISKIQESNSKEKESKILLLKSQKDSLKRTFDEELKKYISEAKLLFLTSSKFLTLGVLHNIEIDNLVIDEGSMMSIPHLLCMASKVKKRIIISGDFKQLGPIALSNSENAKKWLHKDLFSLLGNEDQIIVHKSVHMLKYQRRSAAAIAQLINRPFYGGRLHTQNLKSHTTAIHLPPTDGHISFVNLPSDETNRVHYSASRSKYNPLSRKVTLNLVQNIIDSNDSIETIGIITPYRQQVIDYRLDLQYIDTKSIFVKVGTIHTFQGSECDIIIWDIVDAFNEPIGLLYLRQTGERLVNVAISRAKSKLIIVGPHRIFHECKGGDLISLKLKKIISAAWDFYLNKKSRK